MSPSISKPRYIYLDILRVIACFFVCYNHAYGYHLFLDQEADGSLLSWINVCLSSVVAINIPLFFMISGALLLCKKESYTDLLSKRVSRVLVLIFVTSIITYILVPRETPSIRLFIYQLFRAEVTGSLWYLYAYLGLLLALPFLRPAVQEITGKDILFLVILRTLFRPALAFLNFCLELCSLDVIQIAGYFQLPLALVDCFFCPIVGYYLTHRFATNGIARRQLFGWIAVFFGSCLIASVITYAEGYCNGFTQNFIGEFGYSAAMGVFVFVRYIAERFTLPKKLTAFFSAVSPLTLGIFLLEGIIAHYLYTPFFSPIPWHPVIITIFSVVWCIVYMSVAGSITWLLKKIPGVSRYL